MKRKEINKENHHESFMRKKICPRKPPRVSSLPTKPPSSSQKISSQMKLYPKVQDIIAAQMNDPLHDIGLFNCENDVTYSGHSFGEGTDGVVHAVQIQNQWIALKQAKPLPGVSTLQLKQRTAIECYYLRRVRNHDQFIQCLGICDGIDHTCLALQVMEMKLSTYTKLHKETMLDTERLHILHQVCTGMTFLHTTLKIAHGDLALRNILIKTKTSSKKTEKKIEVRLSDFGRIRAVRDEPTLLLNCASFYQNADVGSFGRDVLYRLVVGERINDTYVSSRTLPYDFTDVYVETLPPCIEAKLGVYKNLFYRCARWGVRPSFAEIQTHLSDLEYFTSGENDMFQIAPPTNNGAYVSPITKLLTPQASSSLSSTTPTNLARKCQRAMQSVKITPRQYKKQTLTMKLLNQMKEDKEGKDVLLVPYKGKARSKLGTMTNLQGI